MTGFKFRNSHAARHQSAAPDAPAADFVEEVAQGTVSTRRQIPFWAPLRNPIFRALWLASLASNIGTWMHDVGASWLMTSLTRDPQINSLVLAASSLPICLLALPAGAVADIVDRRKLIIGTMAWMAISAGLLAVLTLNRATTPWMLLGFTLLISIGSAMTGPAWQAVVPEVVKKRHLPMAMSLNGIAFNTSRVVGPALGGLVIKQFVDSLGNRGAPGAVFALNAFSYLAVVLVMVAWKREDRRSDLPPEHVLGAMGTGLRYLRHSPELRHVLIRVAGFMLSSCVLWSMLPLYSRTVLHLDASGYGSLLGGFGAGAVLAGLSFSRVRQYLASHDLVRIATYGAVVGLLMLATVSQLGTGLLVTNLARFAMFLCGISWVNVMLTCNVVLMRTVPDWVRSRAASMFLLSMTGSSAVGSVMWGAVASRTDILTAFVLGAVGLTCNLVFLRKVVVKDPTNTNFEPATHYPEPELAFESESEAGPVMVTVEYEIEPQDALAFFKAMQKVQRMRLRYGALRCIVFQDVEEPRRWVETLLVSSWSEYLRERARITHSDREIEELAHSYHAGSQPPLTTHLIAGHAERLARDAASENDDDTD